jgi:hypothetical protein
MSQPTLNSVVNAGPNKPQASFNMSRDGFDTQQDGDPGWYRGWYGTSSFLFLVHTSLLQPVHGFFPFVNTANILPTHAGRYARSLCASMQPAHAAQRVGSRRINTQPARAGRHVGSRRAAPPAWAERRAGP